MTNNVSQVEFFNAQAATWDERQWEEIPRILPQIVERAKITTTSNVLDIGAGTGILVSYLPQGCGYVGVDISPAMIDIFQKKYPHHTIYLLNFFEQNIFYNQFTHCVIFNSFPHFANNLKLLWKKVADALKPGGKLIIAHSRTSAEVNAYHQRHAAVAQDLFPSKETIVETLKENNFHNIALEDTVFYWLEAVIGTKT